MVESEKARANANREQLMLKWSRQYTTEHLDSEFSPSSHYLKPDLVTEEDGIPFSIDVLIDQLEYPMGQLFRILGPQGVGKTMLREWLHIQVPDSISLKLDKSGISEQLKEIYVDCDEVEVKLVINALARRGHVHIFDKKAPMLIGSNDATEKLVRGASIRFDADGEASLEIDMRYAIGVLDEIRGQLPRLLGKKEMAQIELELGQQAEFPWDTIILDFRDYDEKRPAQMRKDADRLQDFWEQKRKDPPNIVVFWQEEFVVKGRQFWWGKFKKLRIKPFGPEQLADFFIELFGSPDPFTRDALVYVADAARGIFRQFKLYIDRCLIAHEVNPITVEHAQEWMPSKDSEEDMLQNLISVFPRSEDNRRKATRILQYLKENGPTSQPDITAEFFGSSNSDQVACVRLIKRLETHGHIQRSRVGHKKMISLNEESDKNE